MSKAIVIHQTGGPEVLSYETRTVGKPEPGHALVRVASIGVNFIDVYFRMGLYPRALPFVEGLEGAGVIESTGAGVEDFSVGDRVAWAAGRGSYAEHIIIPTSRLVQVPDSVSDELAAASMLQGMTAHYLTHGVRDTRPGDVALVHAAAGGTGLLLVQYLKMAGATIIGTCSTDDKARLARDAGVDHVIKYTSANFVSVTREVTNGTGVDVVYDSVGRDTFARSLECLRPKGLLVLFGQSSGSVPPFELRKLNELGSLFITRPSLGDYTLTRSELEARATEVLACVGDGRLVVRINARFPLSEAVEAHRALESRTTTGKILLLP